ncbi:MAG: IS1634 family transposase [Candidatus Latescibacterota bacterium]
MNLGKLDLPRTQWKLLADRIEEKVVGRISFLSVDKDIENLATHYAQLLIQKRITLGKDQGNRKQEAAYETIDINSVSNSKIRTLGAEYIGYATFKELGLESFFEQLGMSKKQLAVASLSLVGKLVYPASERRTRAWAQHISGLDELLETDFTHLSNNALYRSSDLLLSYKNQIERHLKLKERDLFSLKGNIILYDLTNTYFEGRPQGNKKAKWARSKEKRNDCPLVTLGLALDEIGFPQASEVFEGNIYEGDSLLKMLALLQGEEMEAADKVASKEGRSRAKKKNITVVMDAGIAQEANLTLLKTEGYDYLCVARNKPFDASELGPDSFVTIKQDKANKVEATLVKEKAESVLYCKSFLKAKKEQAIKTKMQQRFEEGIEKIVCSLTKKRGTKNYGKVLERIGRLKEKYASIAQYYKVAVKEKEGVAVAVEAQFVKKSAAEQRFSGSYFLRTSRTDLNEQAIWSLYVMLTNVEDAFRYLKDELGLRPIHHQKETRCDGHLFVTVLAYHLLISIQTKLRKHGIHMRWSAVRDFLSSHVRVTTGMTTKEDKRIYVRNSSDPEPFHKTIYNALGLSHLPLEAKRIKI